MTVEIYSYDRPRFKGWAMRPRGVAHMICEDGGVRFSYCGRLKMSRPLTTDTYREPRCGYCLRKLQRRSEALARISERRYGLERAA